MGQKDFTHLELNEEIKTISGHFVFQNEHKLTYDGREILYLTGYGVTDSSCCGVAGCTFSYVPGFIERWHYRQDGNGPVSLVEPIEDEAVQKEVAKIIQEREKSQQVNFY